MLKRDKVLILRQRVAVTETDQYALHLLAVGLEETIPALERCLNDGVAA